MHGYFILGGNLDFPVMYEVDTIRTGGSFTTRRVVAKQNGMLYLKNYEIDRWPSGNPETGYLNTYGSPTKTEILNLRRDGTNKHFWRLNFGKRVSEELYNTEYDPFCINNLADNITFEALKAQLKLEMKRKLLQQNDLRMKGFGHLYEAHAFTRNNKFYDRFMAGEETSSG